jgi:hypothetical protein
MDEKKIKKKEPKRTGSSKGKKIKSQAKGILAAKGCSLGDIKKI